MICTFFGHKDTPQSVKEKIKKTIMHLIDNDGIVEFYLGNNGSYDVMVNHTLIELQKIYPQIKYTIVLSYLPRKNSEGFDSQNTIYPDGIEHVPPRFAIDWRNRWLVDKSDVVVTYVNRDFGGAAKFKRLAVKKCKRVIEINE